MHPKHYEYGYRIAEDLSGADVDLYYVFSTYEDKNEFFKSTNSLNVKYLILTDFSDLDIIQNTNSFVSIKKLYAVSQLYDKYDYLSCVDAEIMFLKKTGFYQMMKSICEAKTICGGVLDARANNEISIVRESLTNLTHTKYHDELKNLSKNYTIYTWWCNIPVYDCKHVSDFMNWINFNNTNLDRFSWNVFDDILYNFYCILKHNYVLKEIANCNHSLEFANHDIVEYVDKTLCKLYWVNKNAYEQSKEYFEHNGFYIVFHLDRKW